MSNEIRIKSLVFPDNVRTRPGMYIGDTIEPSVVLREVVDNDIDEALANHANRIHVFHGEVNIAIDNGRGVPVYEIKEEDNKYNGKTMAHNVWGSLHSSSKFDDDEISVGMNGVGASCTNALSEYFEGYINIGKKEASEFPTYLAEWVVGISAPVYKIRFEKGLPVSEQVIEFTDCPEEIQNFGEDFGTAVYFKADASIWESIIPKYETVNLEIVKRFTDIRDNCEILINGEEVGEYSLTDKFKGTSFINGAVYEVEADASLDDVTAKFKILFGYSGEDFDTSNDGSINTVHTPDGVHIKRAQKGIGKAMSELVSTLNVADGKYGLRLFSLCFTNTAVFNSQTKENCKNIKGLNLNRIENAVCEAILAKAKGRTDEAKEFRNYLQGVGARIVEYKRKMGSMSLKDLVTASIQNGSERKNARGLNLKGLHECSTANRKEAELFIVEGDSAKGSLLQSRNPKYHAILGLKGKPKNAANMDIEATLENVEMTTMLNAIGCGVHPYDVDIEASLYGKICIFADEDPDGKHIQALLIGNFIKYLPEVIQAGMLYIVDAPLYRQGEHYFKSDGLSLQDGKTKMNRDKAFDRFKGLGEMNPEQIGPIAFGQQSTLGNTKIPRTLIRVTADNIDEAITYTQSGRVRKQLMIEKGLVEVVDE